MNNSTIQYEAAQRPLTTVIDAFPAESWANPSPCEGWSAHDVLKHLIETQRDFLTGHGIDLGGSPYSDPDTDLDPVAAWRDHAKRVTAAISDDAVPAMAFEGHFGPTTVGATLEQFYVWDMLVHRWDIARSHGSHPVLSDAEIEQIERGADAFGGALYMDGVCRPGVTAPVDADRVARLLARLGRRA